MMAEGRGGGGASTLAFACYVLCILPVLLALSGLPDWLGRRPLVAALCLPLAATTLTLLYSGLCPLWVAILLAWATVGVVIAILPLALALHGLSVWAGLSTFGICICGLLFQPRARRQSPLASTQLGLIILPIAYALIVWGAFTGSLAAVLLGKVAASM